MKKTTLLLSFCILTFALSAQSISAKLATAFKQFENDAQLKHAISSLYVIDAKTGKVVFDKNSQIGLAGASTQKIITAATAFELLGKDFRYKTEFWKYYKESRFSQTFVRVIPSGDPTLGSDRYNTTKPSAIIDNFVNALDEKKITPKTIYWSYYSKDFEPQNIPEGWIWQDIGNYYGAGSGVFNWRENQADIILSSGNVIGSPVKIIKFDTLASLDNIRNELKAGPKNSGDNAYYFVGYRNFVTVGPLLKGTIPISQDSFSISVTVVAPFYYFVRMLEMKHLASNISTADMGEGVQTWNKEDSGNQLVYTHYSPTLDSIIYWFLKKSINLYGEALIKTFAYEKKGFGSTDSGIAIVKDFWKQKGIDENELNIVDGSGLSPLNRITTHAQVEILKHAKTKDWFPYFYDALPEYNNMKMKSGTINGVKGFAGYQTSKSGNEYIFSFLVNNYNGSPSALVDKMYRVLDVLK